MRNYEVTGLKIPRILFGQFICELQKFSPPPRHARSWEYWLLRIKFPPNLRLKTILLGWKTPLVNRGIHRIVKNGCWHKLKYFHEIWYLNIFRKSEYLKRMTCMTDIWREALCTFMVPDWVLLRMKSVTGKSSRLNEANFSILIIFNENFAVYVIMFKRVVQPDISEMTIW